MPTFTNNGSNLKSYENVSGGMSTAKPGEQITSFKRLDVIDSEWTLDSEIPHSDRVMRFIEVALSGTTTSVITLTDDEIRNATRIIVFVKGANRTLTIHADDSDLKASTVLRKLDVNGGFTYVKIYPKKTIAKLYLTPNMSGTAYVYIDQDFPQKGN